jgi:FAD dependent monooxygenase
MIFPAVSRIFDQFGILKNILATTTPVQSECTRWPDGTINTRGKMMDVLGEKFEIPVVLFDRQRCVEHLYNGLPNKSPIRTSARVERIEHTPTSVKVHLTDGTFEEGDLVIGADGVHSRVRESMWEYAAEHEPDAIPESDKSAMYTQFKGFFGVSEQAGLPDIGPADCSVGLGENVTKLLFTSLGQAYWALIWRDEFSQPPKRYRPDEQEKEEIAEKFKKVQFAETLTFGDLYKNKTRSGALNIEEGILEKWHAGRIVLVGDSAHKVRQTSPIFKNEQHANTPPKMTADLGIGANIAIESAISLCNLLHRASAQSDPLTPSALFTLFTQYQTQRYPRAKLFVQLSGEVTRMRSYETPWQKFFISRLAPWFENVQVDGFVKSVKEAPKLEYVGCRTINEGAVGWIASEETKGGWTKWVVGSVVVVAGVAWVVGERWR